MAISQDEKDELKRIVLFETEKLFSKITGDYQKMEHRDKMFFLLDLENAMKDRLVDFDSAGNK
ncbi:MAG TPA: hypothetical protein VGC97_03995 [Pyrinomonadaceae bacterium]|jgi:hypothetical protein